MPIAMSEQGIRLIVGLGNPGSGYAETRHNAGFWFVDLVARRFGGRLRNEAKFHGMLARVEPDGFDLRLLQPLTFMNRSGQSVAAVARYFDLPPHQILVAHDELDLPPGQVRLKQGGGHAGHNGLRDIMSALGSRDFWRLRIGIDRPPGPGSAVQYVLSRPGRAEARAIEDGLDLALDSLVDILSGRFPLAMNRLHAPRP
jgi:PTH1 family peptidyl-tRNA hydrolase